MATALLQPLRHRSFWLLWAGQSASSLGNYMLPVALPLLALARGYGAVGVGLFFGCQQLGSVLSLPLGGVISDRYSRRTVMIASDAVRFVCVVALGLVSGTFPIAVPCALALALGLGEGIFYPAYGGILPLLIDDELLQPANSLNAMSDRVGMLLGPALAGSVVAAASASALMFADALTFLISLCSLAVLRMPTEVPSREREGGLFAEFRDGMTVVWQHRWLRFVIAMDAGLILLAYAPVVVLSPVLAVRHFGGPQIYGYALVAEGVGALIGGAASAALRWRHRETLSLLLLLPVVGELLILAHLGLAVLLFAAFAIAGFGQAVFGVIWSTSVQQRIPERLLSRVNSVDWFFSTALLPLGMVLVAPIAHVAGTAHVLYFGAVVAVVLVASSLLRPDVRTFGRVTADDQRTATDDAGLVTGSADRATSLATPMSTEK